MNHIGNSDCKHNAYSPHLRCAINPCGPCEGCQDYARASLGDRITRRLQPVRNRNRKSLLRIGLEISLGLAGAVVVGVPTGLYLGLFGFSIIESSRSSVSVSAPGIQK